MSTGAQLTQNADCTDRDKSRIRALKGKTAFRRELPPQVPTLNPTQQYPTSRKGLSMPLTRGNVVGHDSARIMFRFAMVTPNAKSIPCEMTSAAMDFWCS